MKRHQGKLALISVFLYSFIYLPLLVVVIYSFNMAKFGAGWRGFTTKWYGVLFQNEVALQAALTTLKLALLSTTVATIFGTMLGLGLSKGRGSSRSAGVTKVANGLLYLPVTVPDILMAVGLVAFYGIIRDTFGLLTLGFWTMVISHVTFEIPFVALVVKARLQGLNKALPEAAADLGASTWQTFRFVTFPLILPGIISGALLAFTVSLDDFVVSFFTTGPGATTLSILIYSSVKRGISPEINALSSLMILASVILTIIVAKISKRSGGIMPVGH
jgi:spermidine/putrescine transport system permease protein